MLTPKFWKKYFLVYDHLNKLIPYKKLLQEICNDAKIKKGDKILDLGSGTGNLSIMADELRADTVGIDFSKEGIEIHKTKRSSAKIIYLDISNRLPFLDNYFDAVISNNVLYSIPRIKRKSIFKELYRITKPNGYVVISNIVEEFSPFKIYVGHVKEYVDKFGVIMAIKQLTTLIIPTLKIFYYNFIISYENRHGMYDFFVNKEQKNMLELAGFKYVSCDKFVYCDQAILNYAVK